MRSAGRWLGVMVASIALGLLHVAVPLGSMDANAYCTNGIGRWRYSTYTPYVRSNVPSAWQGNIASAVGQWNGISGSTLRYNAPVFNSQIANPEFSINAINFSSSGLPDVPGIANGAQNQNHLTVAVSLNTTFVWNTTGVMNQSQRRTDVWTITVHEVGHASGLAHPYAEICGRQPTSAERASVMYVDWTTKRNITSDDRAGIAARY